MGERMRAMDWSKTALGPAETWPQSLRSTVSMLLPSKAQIIVFWGPQFTVLYNDAYRPVFGAKHPSALGLPGREAWSEIWDSVLHELLAGVVRTGEAFWAKDLLFEARALRLSGRDLLRRLVRSGARRVRRRRRRVLHRDRNHRTGGGRTTTGPAEGSGANEMRPHAPLAMPACSPLRHSPPSRRTSCSRSRTWTTNSNAALPERKNSCRRRRATGSRSFH